MKKSVVFGLIGVILAVVATTCVVIQMTADDEPKPKETASKKTTKQKPIEMEGGDTEEGSQREEAHKKKEIRQVNQDLIAAYFTYNSTEEQFNHLLPLVTETFQEKMKEASGMTDSSVKSKVVSQESYYNQERFFHPTVVNIVTNRVTVNGKSYDQTNYVRFHFTSENNQWKMEDVTVTPVAQ
ncbi:hypothetical protein D3Y79_13140 [Listeria monocytogenes]|nr:hypothetical protein [Listeria monocytogenes]EAD0385848.1 hypothetical protein [Listeria monocytogenes]EAF2023328.1 hypothetical protein [Listeria monocytogenes]EAH0493904.1 hypothetical protein [Listeria monocytogenes]